MRLENAISWVARGITVFAAAGLLFSLPDDAAGWGEKAHARIAELALEQLPPEYQGMGRFMDDIVDGASGELKEKKWIPSLAGEKDMEAEIELLLSIPHDEDSLSHYFAYRMGALSQAVANTALPLAANPGPKYRALLKGFESDIDREVESYKIADVSCESMRYPSIYLGRISGKSRVREGAVRDCYLAGEGYRDCREEIVMPSFQLAVEAVANIWTTVLMGDSARVRISAAQRKRYYISQIGSSSLKSYFGDVIMALETLQTENKRVPLTRAIVGNDFFNLPCNKQTGEIYKLAMLVDPQSSVMAEKQRACEEYLLLNPEIETKKKPRPKRKIPGFLHGRDGNEPDIYVYEHDSGLLLLTSKAKDVGPDFVLLNFSPIKKINRRKVVHRFRGEPQVAEYDLEAIIKSYSRDYGVSPALVKAIIKAESDFDPHAVSPAGARGLMQLMPNTALEMEVDDIFDPIQNVGGGVQYFARMLELFNNDTSLALAAYNAGPGNVLRYGGVPPFKETEKYVPRVLTYYDHYKGDRTPVRLKVALNEKPAVDYLPDVEIVREIEEVVSTPSKPERAPKGYVIVKLKNGSTMRGRAYEETPLGVKLKVDGGWVVIRSYLIAEII